MISKLINKIVPLIHTADIRGDGDCMLFKFFNNNVQIRFDPHYIKVVSIYVMNYDMIRDYKASSSNHTLVYSLKKASDDWMRHKISQF